MSNRVIVTTADGRQVAGQARSGVYPDGTVYVTLDGGCAANFPADRVTPVEDKTLPMHGLETK